MIDANDWLSLEQSLPITSHMVKVPYLKRDMSLSAKVARFVLLKIDSKFLNTN